MRILLVSETYLDLYVPILQEFKKQGHEVVFIPGDTLPSDTHRVEMNPINRCYKRIYNYIFDVYTNYWKAKFNEIPELNQKFDYYIDIQGVTFCPYLLNRLKSMNPHIKSTLYIWDSSMIYDYFRNAKYFDKVLSFDFDDSKKYDYTEFLPIYWTPVNSDSGINCDLSIVGTDHDDRLRIVENIAKQAKAVGLKVDFRIYVKKPAFSKNPLIVVWRKFSPKWKKIYNDYYKNIESEYVISEKISVEEVQQIMLSSRCVIDTDIEKQTGVTPRLLWALAIGKKVITTNKDIVKMPFYNSAQIKIVDRNNPMLDVDFVKEEKHFVPQQSIERLRIDRWINYLL